VSAADTSVANDGKPKRGRPPSPLREIGFTRQQVYEFTLMAEYPDIVEAVIAASDDASPPSHRKVMAAIHEHRRVGAVKKDPAVIGRQLSTLLADYRASVFLDQVLRFVDAMPVEVDQ
jgi:hypothetical protein